MLILIAFYTGLISFSTSDVDYIIGLPMPRPGIIGASPPARGLLIVSSTDKIMQVASPAACKAFSLITAGSHTQASKLSAICSLLISTPNHALPKHFFEYLNRLVFAFENALNYF